MNTTTTKIAGEAAMTDKMQANDRPMYIFLGSGDVIRATDERYSSTYHKWKPIAPLYVGSTVDASTRPVRRRAVLASTAAVLEGWKLVPVELTEHMLDEADFAMQNHVGDAYTDADGFDGWYQPVWKAILAASPTAPVQSGQWVHCSPALIKAGVSCANMPRRACACDPENVGHDHFIAHIAAPAQSCGDAEQADAPQNLCSICHGYGRYQDGDSGTESDGYAPNIVECECAPEERFPRPDSFEDWASDYGFHAELLDVHQYALEAARDAWQASRAALTALTKDSK
jgi:hypothetical protein